MTPRRPTQTLAADTDATTEQRIAQVTLGILEDEGPEAVSMRRVASAVGITAMAIYHYFPNREALLQSVVDKEFESFQQLIEGTPALRSMEAEISHIMDGYVDYALARPRIFEYVFSKPRPGARRYPADFRARRSPTLNPVADAVAKWLQRGALKHDDVWEIALELWAHAHGYVMLYLAGRFDLSDQDFKKLLQRSLRRLLHGLKA